MAMAEAKHQDRNHYFTPSEVSSDLSCGTRSCVPACCAFLGLRPPPNGAHPSWSHILKRISPPGSDIRSFNNLNDIKKHLDNLFVATINKNRSCGVGHAAVVYRGEDQEMGSTKCYLFNPGKPTPQTEIDLNNKRNTAGWNSICAAFIPGADIPTKESDEIISIMDSSEEEDDDEEEKHRHIIRSRLGSTAATSSASRPSSSRVSPPTTERNGPTQYPRTLPQSIRGGGDTDRRRNPPRNTKKMGRKPFLFYKECCETIPARQDAYSRVTRYICNDQFCRKECNKEMIGQHVSKYLQSRGDWVVWFHHESSQFIIARRKSFSGYDIDGAEEGKDKFTGYAALAEWAFKFEEGNIYEESLKKKADGEAFLNGVDCDKDDLDKLFKSNISTAPKRKKKRYLRCNGDDATTTRKKKRHDDDDEAEQYVAEFDEDCNANKAYAAKPAAPSDEDESGESSKEESCLSNHGNNFAFDDEDNNDYDDEEWNDYEIEKQAGESSIDSEEGLKPKPKQVFTEAASPESSQGNEEEEVSDLEDDSNGSKTAQSSQQEEQEDGEGRNMIEAGNQAIVEDPGDTKRQAEAKLKAELKVSQNEVHRLLNEMESDHEELRRLRDEIEKKDEEIVKRDEEIARLCRELAAVTNATTAEVLIPDYIVELGYNCDDRVASGVEDECTEKILLDVSAALRNRDERMIGLAKRYTDKGQTPEKVVESLVNIQRAENKRKG